MIEVFPMEKFRVIAESSQKQFYEIEQMRLKGELSPIEANEYQRLVIEVFHCQKAALIA